MGWENHKEARNEAQRLIKNKNKNIRGKTLENVKISRTTK